MFGIDLFLQTNVCSKDLTQYSDFMLQNRQALQRYLFIATVENPTQTIHYTGLFLYFFALSFFLFIYTVFQMIVKGMECTLGEGVLEREGY